MNIRQKKKLFKKLYHHNPPKFLALNSLTLNPEYMKKVMTEIAELILEDIKNFREEQQRIEERYRRIHNLEIVNRALTRRNYERRKKYHW